MQIKATRQQTVTTTLSTGESAEIDFIYAPAVMRWFYNARIGDRAKNGYKLNRGVNMLEGISTLSKMYCVGSFDFPFLMNDFEDGNFDVVEAL